MLDLTGDWFRSDEWGDEAQRDFEGRLGQAAAGDRPQYLRIKGAALSDAGRDDAARELWLRVVRDFPTSLDSAAALEHLGDLERRLGFNDVAESYYRDLLKRSPSLNGTSGMADVSLAEMLIDRNNEPDRDAALLLLQSALHRGNLLGDRLFRWHVALARAGSDMGDRETQQRAARTALRILTEAPAFSDNPAVGTVTSDQQTIDWLEQLAAGRGPTPPAAKRQRSWLRRR